jgi:hypothetical protein
MAVVGNGNIDVGNKTPTRKPGRPIVEKLAGSDGAPELRIDNQPFLQPSPKTERVRICGAMSQQQGDSGRGNESVPQKFVHLVGCRDPEARASQTKAELWVRPRPAPKQQS